MKPKKVIEFGKNYTKTYNSAPLYTKFALTCLNYANILPNKQIEELGLKSIHYQRQSPEQPKQFHYVRHPYSDLRRISNPPEVKSFRVKIYALAVCIKADK